LCDGAVCSAQQSSIKQHEKNVPAEVINSIMMTAHIFIAAKILDEKRP